MRLPVAEHVALCLAAETAISIGLKHNVVQVDWSLGLAP